MASTGPYNPFKSAGIKKYLRRVYTQTQLQTLADSLVSQAQEEVVIISTAADGGSASGEISMPAGELLLVVEEILQDLGVYPVNADGSIVARQLCTRPDFSRTWSTT